MIKAFLRSLEDPEMPLLGPNYWMMKKIGIILPDKKIYKYAYISLHWYVAFFILTQFAELYVTRSDLNLVITNVSISMVSSIVAVKTNTCVMWQDSWREVIKYVSEADKYERDNRDDVKGKIIDKYTKYCRRVTYCYWVLVIITVVSVVAAPFMKLSSPTFRDKVRNGTELFPHITSSWMPFDKYKSPGCWITIFYHVFMSCYGGCTISGFDSSMIVIMVFFGAKLDLLRETSNQLFGNADVSLTDEEVGRKLRHLHEVHVLLTKYSKLFNSLLSPVMFSYVVTTSLMLCSSAYQLTTATTTSQKLVLTEWLVFGVTQLFIYCWHSNDVLLKSQNLLLGPYESEWWNSNVSLRKDILILTEQFRIKYIFTAGPFTNLTLSSFITIIKGAYSYYTLLRKIK